MNLDYPSDHPGWQALLSDLDDAPLAADDAPPVGWTALPPAYSDRALPGVGCWYRVGPGEAWGRMPLLDWVWLRMFGFRGQYVRRTK